MVDESGFSDRILMTGYIEDVSGIYSMMDVSVHASIRPEPFGLVIIEAMVNAVPVIASDLGAPKEIITDSVNGYIINPESSEKLAETIINLLSDVELRDRIGNKGRDHVLENYQVKRYAHTVEKIYSEVPETTL